MICIILSLLYSPIPTVRAETMWITAANNNILDFTVYNRPKKTDGVLLLPHFALDDKDSDLGAKWQWLNISNNFVVTVEGRSITFRVGRNTAFDDENNTYEAQCLRIRESGVDLFLLPVAFLCEFFDWTYKETYLFEYGLMMLRIKSRLTGDEAALRDDVFLWARADLIREKYLSYTAKPVTPTPIQPTPTQPAVNTPTLPPQTRPSPPLVTVTPDSRNKTDVYLLFRGGINEYTMGILDLLDIYGIKAAFFISGADLEYTEELRRIASTQALGLEGETADEFESLNEDIGKITMIHTRLVLMKGGSSKTASEDRIDIVNRGYRYWDYTLKGESKKTILDGLDKARDIGEATVLELNHSADTFELLEPILEVLEESYRIMAIDSLITPINQTGDICLPENR